MIPLILHCILFVAALGPSPIPVDAVVQHLEPAVHRHAGTLSESHCKEIVGLAEKSRFLVLEGSIDTLYIYQKSWTSNSPGRVDHEPIWNFIEPQIVPTLTKFVAENRDDEAFRRYYDDEPRRESVLHWAFLRRYPAGEDANHTVWKTLATYADENMHTVSVALNGDYEGGELFYVKPPDQGYDKDGRPNVSDQYRNYNWTDGFKRENKTDVIFPTWQAGDSLLYNYTVYHGMSPVTSGTRYVMTFYFDHDNPAIVPPEYDSSDYDSDDEEFIELIQIEVHNNLSSRRRIDLYLVYDAYEEEDKWEVLFDRVKTRDVLTYHAYEGDELRAFETGKTEVSVGDFTVRRGRTKYVIADGKDEL